MNAFATPDTLPGSALLSRNGRQIPLQDVKVEADVVDLTARVTVRQTYRNTENVPLEVVYVFPLDEGAAVCGFEADVDGVRYTGRVVEREEAFTQYDEAMEAGHGAFLLEEERADVFTASLGNLNPGSVVTLSITYVTELAAEGGAGRFTLPTTVSPRYAPAEDMQGVGPTQAEVLNPPVGLSVPYRFTFTMNVAMNGAISSIQSPTHPIEVKLDGSRAEVRLAQRSAAMDRDLVVIISAYGMDTPHATLERGETGCAVMLSFVPRFEATRQQAEVVFMVDRSGSMSGTSIAEVRNALQLCLRSLGPDCRFNIVSFGSHYEALFDDSRPYDETSFDVAAKFIASMDADMGGTELLPALEFVLGRELVPGFARQVFLLTDGQVTNTDAILHAVQEHAGTTRFFTFGIGAGASLHLVRGVARASRGAAEFISPGERIEEKVMRQFKRAFAPSLREVKLDWGGLPVVPGLDEIPPLFNGERVTLYWLLDDLKAGTVTLSGVLVDRPVSFTVPVLPEHAIEGTIISTLAARQRIRTLEERGEYLENKGSRQRRLRENKAAIEEIVALGIKHQLCSRETSFVAIEERETSTTTQAELRRVPVALTSGWGGFEDRWMGNAVPAFVSADAMYDMPCELSDCLPREALRGPRAGLARRRFAIREVCDPREVEDSTRPLDRLIALQRAGGYWELDGPFAEAIGKELAALEAEAAQAAGDAATKRRALATALALAWLEKNAQEERGQWEMLAEKARLWLASAGVTAAGDESWTVVAERILATS